MLHRPYSPTYLKNLQTENFFIFVCDTAAVQTHSHPFLELVYVLRGEARHTLDDSETTIRPGDFFFLDYGSYHSYQEIGDEPFEIINCLFLPSLIDKSLINCRSFPDLLNNYLIKLRCETMKKSPAHCIFHDDDGTTLDCLSKMMEEFEQKKVGYLEIIRSVLIELIIRAMRRISEDAVEQHSAIVQTVLDKIQTDYAQHFTLSDFATQSKWSLPYLSKKFKEETGLSFSEYLQKVRIEQACRLLSHTDKKITEIAELTGYSDVNFFCEVFRRNLLMAPSEYRKVVRTD